MSSSCWVVLCIRIKHIPYCYYSLFFNVFITIIGKNHLTAQRECPAQSWSIPLKLTVTPDSRNPLIQSLSDSPLAAEPDILPPRCRS